MDDKKQNKNEEVYSKRIRAGRKRTYFIDVKTTRNNDYYITITESKKDFKNPNYYIKHKIFLYKEDFNKFIKALDETVDHVKTELLPDYDFDMYDREDGIITDDKSDEEVGNVSDESTEEESADQDEQDKAEDAGDDPNLDDGFDDDEFKI